MGPGGVPTVEGGEWGCGWVGLDRIGSIFTKRYDMIRDAVRRASGTEEMLSRFVQQCDTVRCGALRMYAVQ